MTVLLLKLHASHSVVARIVLARMVDLNKQKSLFFMELFLYLIFLDLDKMDIYRDKIVFSPPSASMMMLMLNTAWWGQELYLKIRLGRDSWQFQKTRRSLHQC